MKKSVISLISYDAEYLPDSIKSYYDYVDEIVLGLDKDRISWSGNSFTFDEDSLWKVLQVIDCDNKISVIEGNFHQSSIAIENDNYERNYLKQYCTNDWVFSFDADEVLLNAKDFFYKFCPIAEPYMAKCDLIFTWFLPYKEFDESYLVIANDDNTWFSGDKQGFATHKDSHFTYARWTDNKSHLNTPLGIMHWSLCRQQAKLHEKINNIGHSNLAEKDPFFDTWKKVNLDNFTQLRNFKSSGLGDNQWPKLVEIIKPEFDAIAHMNLNVIY